MKKILDVCCGGRSFWYDKKNENTIYMDIRKDSIQLCDGRRFIIEPDIIADFQNIPFPDESFYLVVFDPPHLIYAGQDSWLAQKYGTLKKNWQEQLKKGFNECMRVLKKNGSLIVKWNEEQISFNDIQKLIGKPLFGDRRSKTRWSVYFKAENNIKTQESADSLFLDFQGAI